MFDPTLTQKTDLDWREIAEEANESNGNPNVIVTAGIVAGALLVGLTSQPIIGVILAGAGFWEAWQLCTRKGRNDEVIQYGCYAPVLNEKEFQQYLNQVGEEQVYKEIDWATQQGHTVSQIAQLYLQWYKQYRTEKPSQPALPAKPLLGGEAIAPHHPLNPKGEGLSEIAIASNCGGGPNLREHSDPAKRMKVLLQALAAEGFPLGSLIYSPFVWCWGQSQSGKTTVALMLALARMALGHQVSYYSTDKDVSSKSVKWAEFEETADGYRMRIEAVAKRINDAEKAALKHNNWIFDEMLLAHSEHEIQLAPLITAALGKGAKTRGGLIGISQVDTSGAHGLKNLDASWRANRISLGALYTEDALGERSPTGRYEVVKNGGQTEIWTIPNWMRTEKNEYGHPDPVVWMLNRFPELVNKAAVSPVSAAETSVSKQADFRAQLEKLISGPSAQLKCETSGETAPETDETQSEQEVEFNSPDVISDFISEDETAETNEISPERVHRVIEMKRADLTQTQIIGIEWKAKPGKTQAYLEAVEQYKTIIEQHWKES